jgi:serine/threonine protein kinase
MDRQKALELLAKIKGKAVGRWTIDSFIDNGKSAAVFLANGSEGAVALKIFDDEIVLRFGGAVQLARIERELELAGHYHPNTVKILGGGVDPLTNNHYIVMEYLEGENLKQCLERVPPERVPIFVSQLASAAEFLENLGYAHRDIKPENIHVSKDFSKITLLDFGVLRPILGSDLTDAEGVQPFIGTLQYSSPEFLLRQEDGSPSGWRALSFYQIGGVIHDLIMRRPLFAEFAEPYARLVNAVQHQQPVIQNSAVPNYLLELARCCLLKDWRKRLELVDWRSFDLREPKAESAESSKQRVTNRSVLAHAERAELASQAQRNPEATDAALVKDVLSFLKLAVRSIRAENPLFPPLRVLANTPDESGFVILFGRSDSFGLLTPLTLVFRVSAIDSSIRIISVVGYARTGDSIENLASGYPCDPFYIGSFDSSILRQRFEECIYDLVDQAQQSGGVDVEVEWLYPTGA